MASNNRLIACTYDISYMFNKNAVRHTILITQTYSPMPPDLIPKTSGLILSIKDVTTLV